MIFYLFKGGTREVVAVKCVAKSSLNKESTENLLTEIELLKNLHHEHIVQLNDFQVTIFLSDFNIMFSFSLFIKLTCYD